MPELPDVEMARRLLDGALRGAKITRAASADRVVLRPTSPSAFAQTLIGRKVTGVEQRGKWLRLLLDDGGRLFSHLGMTGEWVVATVDEPPQRFERARLDVIARRAHRSIRYLDARRFGRLVAAHDDITEWTTLGPDPLADGLDPKTLATALGKIRRPVKEALMDQTVLAGIGNILATEALWHARVDPRSRSDESSAKDVAAVVRGLRTAIRRQLASREKAAGAEPRDTFFAYGRAEEPCKRCSTLLHRIVLGGRGTTFCAHCQRRPASA